MPKTRTPAKQIRARRKSVEIDPSQATQSADVDEVGDGGDDDRRQDRLGQVVEQRQEEEHRHDQEGEEHDARQLGLDARRLAHG